MVWRNHQRQPASGQFTGLGGARADPPGQWFLLPTKIATCGGRESEKVELAFAAESARQGQRGWGDRVAGQARNPSAAIRCGLRKRPAPRLGVVIGMADVAAIGGHPTGERTDQNLAGPGRSTGDQPLGCSFAASARQERIVPARSRPKVPPTVQTPWLALLSESPFSVWPWCSSFGLTRLRRRPGQTHDQRRGSGRRSTAGRRFSLAAKDRLPEPGRAGEPNATG